MINVRDHGIISGTKKDAPANTESLVRLIKSLGGRGGLIYWPAGTYWLTSFVTEQLDKKDTTYLSWLGDGIKATQLHCANPVDGCLFDWSGLNVFDVTFSGIGFYKGHPAVMRFSGGRQYRIAIRDCSFRDSFNGLHIHSGQHFRLDNVLCFRNQHTGLTLAGTLNVNGIINVEQNGEVGVHILADESGSRRSLPAAIRLDSLITERNGTDLVIDDGMWGVSVDNVHPRSRVYFGHDVHACTVHGNDIDVKFADGSYSNQAIGHYIRASGNLKSNHTGSIPGVPWRPDHTAKHWPVGKAILDKENRSVTVKHDNTAGYECLEFFAVNMGAGSHRIRIVLQRRDPVLWFDFGRVRWIDKPTSQTIDLTREYTHYDLPVVIPAETKMVWSTIYLDAAGNGLERILIDNPRIV